MLGAFCSVGQGCEIEESVLLDRVRLGDNVRIASSIIDEGVVIPEGERVKNKIAYYDKRGEFKVLPLGGKGQQERRKRCF